MPLLGSAALAQLCMLTWQAGSKTRAFLMATATLGAGPWAACSREGPEYSPSLFRTLLGLAEWPWPSPQLVFSVNKYLTGALERIIKNCVWPVEESLTECQPLDHVYRLCRPVKANPSLTWQVSAGADTVMQTGAWWERSWSQASIAFYF